MDKIRDFFRTLSASLRIRLLRFMQGRHGVDELGLFTLSCGILVSLLGTLFGSFFLILVGYAGEIYTLFRIFSKNLVKRQEENRRFTAWAGKARFHWNAFLLRMKMRKEYKYFRCPGCKSLMRLKRGRGDVDMECPKCHTHFKQHA